MKISAANKTRRKTKKEMVELLGGKCSLCGYKKCMAALAFHHLDPTQKEFAVSKYRKRSLLLEEVKKCILVCSNCHVEIHAQETERKFSPFNKIIKKCNVHGEAYHYSFKRKGTTNKETCAICMIGRQTKHRHKVKRTLVEHLGGKCQKCEYSKEIKALEFHHEDRKIENVSKIRNLDLALKEVEKCSLLCKNCHMEEHWSLEE